MDLKFLSTTNEIAGYNLDQNLGMCTGVQVRAKNIVSHVGASLNTLVGGQIRTFSNLCEKTKHETIELMIHNAVEMGADAIIGIRFSMSEIGAETEMLCYGTAVKISKK